MNRGDVRMREVENDGIVWGRLDLFWVEGERGGGGEREEEDRG